LWGGVGPAEILTLCVQILLSRHFALLQTKSLCL